MPHDTPVEHHTPPARPRRRTQSAYDLRKRRRQLVGYGLFAASLLLVVNSLVGENGYLATIRAEAEHAKLEQELIRTQVENQMLREDIHRINNDPFALEEAARSGLGMIKPGETVVILKDRTPPVPPSTPRRR